MALDITVYTQSCIRISCDEGVVYFDPFRMKEAPHDADYILVTHDHFDHFSPEDIDKVSKAGTILIVPERMLAKAGEVSHLVSQIETVSAAQKRVIDGLKFETVPAYNVLKPFHPKSAGWVGYILITEDKRIYVAGDTDDLPENRTITCDIALVPAGGTYTMDAHEAAAFVNALKPAVAIPEHYGTVAGSPDDGKTFASLVDPSIEVVIKL
jgi:L-ascorbate metabolism protein UlaG (beta-lactamase superfamily)